MEDNKLLVNIADVPMIKLLRALASEGLSLKAIGNDQLSVVEVKTELTGEFRRDVLVAASRSTIVTSAMRS